MRPELAAAMSDGAAPVDFKRGGAVLTHLCAVDRTGGGELIASFDNMTQGELVRVLMDATDRGWVENARAVADGSVRYTLTARGVRAVNRHWRWMVLSGKVRA